MGDWNEVSRQMSHLAEEQRDRENPKARSQLDPREDEF